MRKNEKNLDKYFCDDRLFSDFAGRYCSFFRGAVASSDNPFLGIVGECFNSPKSFHQAKVGAAVCFFGSSD